MSYYSKFPQVLVSGLHKITLAYVAAMSVKPNAKHIANIDRFIVSLDKAGVLSNIGWLSLLNGETSQASLLNVMNPAQSLAITGSPAFVANAGFTSSSASDYLRTPVNMGAINGFTQNNNHYAANLNTTSVNNASDVGGAGVLPYAFCAYTTASSPPLGFYSTNAVQGNVHANLQYSGTAAITTGVGYSVSDRPSSADFTMYRNGAAVTGLGGAKASTQAVPNVPFQLLTNTARQMSVFHAGSSLGATKISAINTAINAYMAGI